MTTVNVSSLVDMNDIMSTDVMVLYERAGRARSKFLKWGGRSSLFCSATTF